MAVPANMECEDFMEFQETLKRMRVLDDKIIYALNSSIPTESFKNQLDATNTCKQLYSQLQENYNQRESAIRKCMSVLGNKVDMLKKSSNLSYDHERHLKTQRAKLRILSSELNVEEILRERTNKVYYERCRQFYKPPDFTL